jgi:hypothetical protein
MFQTSSDSSSNSVPRIPKAFIPVVVFLHMGIGLGHFMVGFFLGPILWNPGTEIVAAQSFGFIWFLQIIMWWQVKPSRRTIVVSLGLYLIMIGIGFYNGSSDFRYDEIGPLGLGLLQRL